MDLEDANGAQGFQTQHEKEENKAKRLRHQKQVPCPAALRLSEELRTLSRNKDLKGALELYRDQSKDSIRDGHHACIVVDCCSRCGSISVRHRQQLLP
jgi:hypothetical protein